MCRLGRLLLLSLLWLTSGLCLENESAERVSRMRCWTSSRAGG